MDNKMFRWPDPMNRVPASKRLRRKLMHKIKKMRQRIKRRKARQRLRANSDDPDIH